MRVAHAHRRPQTVTNGRKCLKYEGWLSLAAKTVRKPEWESGHKLSVSLSVSLCQSLSVSVSLSVCLSVCLSVSLSVSRAGGQRGATERRSPPPGIPLYYSGHPGSISCHLEAPSQPPHSARANHDGGGKTAPGTPHWMVESPQRIVQIMCGVSVKLWVACFHRHISVLACLWFLPIVLRRRELSPGLPRDRRKY